MTDDKTCKTCSYFEPHSPWGFGNCRFPLPHWVPANRYVYEDRGNCLTHSEEKSDDR